MRHLKTLLDFYINSSIHVALAVVCLMRITELELQIPGQPLLYGFVFFGAITGYNFVKYASLAGLHHRHLTQSLKTIQVFSFFCFAIWCYFALQFPLKFWFYCIPLGLLTLLYAIPFLPRKTNLRRIPSIKIFIIALVWAGVTGFLPAAGTSLAIWEIFLITAQRVFLVLALMMPFELRDYRFDSPALQTLPQVLGIKKTKLFGLAMLAGFIGLELFSEIQDLSFLIIKIIITAVTATAILKSGTRQSRYYASFFVEAIPILWLLLIFFTKLAI